MFVLTNERYKTYQTRFSFCCLGYAPGQGLVVVDFLFIVTPIVGVCNCSIFCCMLLYVRSSIAIILMGKRELVALLNLSSWCLVMVEWLFLAVPRGCLQFVIVVCPDHTHLLFFGRWGCGGGQKYFFKHGHVAYQIDDEQNRMQVNFLS